MINPNELAQHSRLMTELRHQQSAMSRLAEIAAGQDKQSAPIQPQGQFSRLLVELLGRLRTVRMAH